MSKHTKTAAVVSTLAAGTLLLGACSHSDAKGEGKVKDAGALTSSASKTSDGEYKPSTGKTWTFKTKDGCKGTLKVVTADQDKFVNQVQNATGKHVQAIKADIDWTGADSSVSTDSGCRVGDPHLTLIHEDGTKQEPVDDEDFLFDHTRVYNKTVDKYDGADPKTKGVSYAIFKHKVKPFTAVQLEPTASSGVYAKQK